MEDQEKMHYLYEIINMNRLSPIPEYLDTKKDLDILKISLAGINKKFEL